MSDRQHSATSPLAEALSILRSANLHSYHPNKREIWVGWQNRDSIVDPLQRVIEILEAQRSETRRIDLSSYVNAANIGGADCPHEVVEKLQRAIESSCKEILSNSAPSAIAPTGGGVSWAQAQRDVAEGKVRELDAIFPLLWHINDHLKITPDQAVAYSGSTNDVDRLRDVLHYLDPRFTRGRK